MSSNKKKIPKAKVKKGSILNEDSKENVDIVQSIVPSINPLIVQNNVEDKSAINNIQDDSLNSSVELEISDDLFDALECDVHELSTEQSLEEKMKKHKQLKETTLQLITEVDRLIELMHRTNKPDDMKEMTRMAGKLDKVNEGSGDRITQDIIANIMGEVEDDVGKIASIEQLNEQVRRYQMIMKKIAICKEYYEKGQINLNVLN